MATDSKMIVGYVILGVGGFLILVAIVLVIVILCKRRKKKHLRPYSPDEFKVVYKMPMANGASTTKITASDVYDGRSVHTITRSEPGYTHVAPPPIIGPPSPPVLVPAGSVISQPAPQYHTQPVIVNSAPVVAVNPVPRAVSMENIPSYTTLPRAGYRYVYPAGTTSRVLVPISKKKAKRMQKRSAKPVYMPAYGHGVSQARSVMSIAPYATSARSVRSAASGTVTGTARRNKYYMYGSTPNLHATHYTQPVLMYDGKKRYFYADELNAGRNQHVQNWLRRDHATAYPDHERPPSRASSAPTDLDARVSDTDQPLTLKWSPSMARRLSEKDRRERESQSLSLNMTAPDSPRRLAPLHSYTELAEAF